MKTNDDEIFRLVEEKISCFLFSFISSRGENIHDARNVKGALKKRSNWGKYAWRKNLLEKFRGDNVGGECFCNFGFVPLVF